MPTIFFSRCCWYIPYECRPLGQKLECTSCVGRWITHFVPGLPRLPVPHLSARATPKPRRVDILSSVTFEGDLYVAYRYSTLSLVRTVDGRLTAHTHVLAPFDDDIGWGRHQLQASTVCAGPCTYVCTYVPIRKGRKYKLFGMSTPPVPRSSIFLTISHIS
jgi:hypothetical protein